MYNILYIDNNSTKINHIDIEKLKNNYNIIILQQAEDLQNTIKVNNIQLILFTADNLDKHKKTFNDNPTIFEKISTIFIADVITTQQINKIILQSNDYISGLCNNDILEHKIKIYLNIISLNRDLLEERIWNNTIMEYSHNMILVHNQNKVVKSNKMFLDFFKVKDINEFNSQHSLSQLFMEYENFYSKHILNENQEWLNNLTSHKGTSNYKVLLMDIDTFEPKAFKIQVSMIENNDNFLITLSDITNLTIKSKEFEMKATYDDLTKIYNRSKFNECIEEQYKLFARYGGDLCFALFDIDFFKKVNDIHGHLIGDETLITFAQTINNNIRSTDIFARWGGEEFTLLLPCTKLEDATFVANNLRKMIEEIDFKIIGQKTCSIGVTQFKKGDTIDTVLVRADEALYEAKETGRNKVCIK